MTQWIYLTDMTPQASILNPTTGEIRQIMSSTVKDRAPSGLRRTVLDELPGGTYRETGEVAPLTPELLDDLEEAYRAPNHWNYDWPHFDIETAADDAMAKRVADRLTAMMSQHPYEFEVTGLQRRFLMYYSDGNYRTQQRFERLVPRPDSPPFRRNGELRRKYNWVYNSNMRDAKVPIPDDKRALYGDLAPCLYTGAAWVVRFRVDGQDVLLDRCRVYVNDDAEFICSDWCQRHDFTSYENGINLQTGLYTFDGWVTGPCLTKNMEAGKFQPKSVVYKRTAVRELMKRAPVAVPKYEDVFAKAQAAVTKYKKHTLETPAAAPVEERPDAGPITPEVMAEAFKVASGIIVERAITLADSPANELNISRIFPGKHTNGMVVRFKHLGEHERGPKVQADLLYVGADYRTVTVDDDDVETQSFIIDEDSPSGFWYTGNGGMEPLNDIWWLYDAAKYYREFITQSAQEPTLTEV